MWGGEPFADLWPEGPPEACRRLAADLEHARELPDPDPGRSRRSARARRTGGPRLPRPAVGVPGDGHGNDAAWLAAFLIALLSSRAPRRPSGCSRPGLRHPAEPGPQPGRRRRPRRRPDAARRGGDRRAPPADRHAASARRRQPARARSAGTPSSPRSAGLPPRCGPGGRAALAVRGASGRGKTRLAEELAASAVAAGLPVVLIGAGQPGDLRPWQELAERLWPAACRDTGAGQGRAAPLTLGERRALLDFVAPRTDAPEPDQAQQVRFGEIAQALPRSARNVAARARADRGP